MTNSRSCGAGTAGETNPTGREPTLPDAHRDYDTYLMHGVYPIEITVNGVTVGHDAVRLDPPRAGRRWSSQPKHDIATGTDSSLRKDGQAWR